MGINRFGLMQRSIPTISKQMLTTQLRELEEDKLIKREIFAEVPPRVEYTVTERGEEIFPILEAMAKWGKSNLN
jgi:DNA-binding HxlR family transcriptional regulator